MSDTNDHDTLLAAFRHDAHKFTGERHATASDELAGIPVNQTVPHGADGDAAALSRPHDTHEQTVPAHTSRRRLSLLTGAPVGDANLLSQATMRHAVVDLLDVPDATTAHERWLTSAVAAMVAESVSYPYTSLKYHTLLVAALLDNYRASHDFADLHLVVDPADEIVPCRTIFAGDRFALRIDAETADRPAAPIGGHPRRSWAATWKQLATHPLATDDDRADMVLDANLRRIGAWSTALQYLEEFADWREDPAAPEAVGMSL